MVRIGEIVDKVRAYNPEADTDLLERAYVFAAMAHRGQVRCTGEPYLSHPLEVTNILADMRMDVSTLAAGLLHDVVEDTAAPAADIRGDFGPEIGSLVEGVSKLAKMAFSTSEEREAENFRKMLVAMARDIRVLLIKLADRLHNMRTLDPLPPERAQRISRETIDIYAPLAHRLGIAWLKSELEDLSFRHLDPEAYEQIRRSVATQKQERERYLKEVRRQMEEKLSEANIQADVVGRAKHFFSIWNKMNRQEIDFSEVYDLIAIRIITGSVRDCYAVLGIIHSLWTPVPGRFKDYVAMPKANMYQSLHTTVIVPGGERVEFQIRTREMHAIAEQGIAAHWKYKEGIAGETAFDGSYQWIQGLLEWQKDLKDPKEFLETVKVDLFPEEVYTFTPRGEVRAFPHGATPVDFAYAVHTDIGHSCTGAKVNGRIVPLRYELKNGDTVEIISTPGHTPSKDWLTFVKTPRARAKIRAWVRLGERTASAAAGRELVEKELRRYRRSPAKVLKADAVAPVVRDLGFKGADELWAAVDAGSVSPVQVVGRLLPDVVRHRDAPAKKRTVAKAPRRRAADGGVLIDGLEGSMVRFARCCNPVPGDAIVGYITRGRGVTIHAVSCPGAERPQDGERTVAAAWDTREERSYPVRIAVEGVDRPGLLAAVSAAIADAQVNITSARIRTGRGRGVNELEMEITDAHQLRKIVRRIEGVKGVSRVRRLRTWKR